MSNPDEIKEQFIRRSKPYKRLRSYIVKLGASHYFKEMKQQDFEEKVRDCVVVKDDLDLKTEQDLADFLMQEEKIPFATDGLMHKSFIIPKFKEDKSLYVFKCHHVLADGLSLL